MKPTKNKPLKKTFKRARLCYQDIIMLENIFITSFDPEEYQISLRFKDEPDVPYEGRNIASLSDSNRSRIIKGITFSAYDRAQDSTVHPLSNITVSATYRNDLEVSADNPTDRIAGVHMKICSLIEPLEHKGMHRLTKFVTTVLPYIFFLGGVFLYMKHRNHIEDIFLSICWAGVIVTLLTAMRRFDDRNNYTRVVSFSDRRKNLLSRENFLKALYDVVLLIVGGFIGGVVTKLFFS